jgi:hypothetical protein
VSEALWNELIKIEDTSGGGVSKSVARSYEQWLKKVRRQMDATPEAEDDMIWGNGIMIDLEQLKDSVVHHLDARPMGHRVKLVKKCNQYVQLSDAQRSEICRVVIFEDAQSPRSFMKTCRSGIR